MSYSTGTVSTLSELIGRVVTAAATAGWNVYDEGPGYLQMTDAQGAGHWTMRVRIPSDAGTPLDMADALGGNYPYFVIVGSKSRVSMDLKDPQCDYLCTIRAGSPCTKFGTRVAGPFTRYHIFATGNYVHVVLEITAGTFGHFMVGNLDKEGAAYTGGQYTAASFYSTKLSPDTNFEGNGLAAATFGGYPFDNTRYPYYTTSHLRVENVDNRGALAAATSMNVSTVEGTFISLATTLYQDQPTVPGVNLYRGGLAHPSAGLVAVSANTLNNSTLLVPQSLIYLAAEGRYRPVGRVPDMCTCDMKNLAPGDILTFGSDRWMVFPAYRKGLHPVYTSLTLGYAYRIVE